MRSLFTSALASSALFLIVAGAAVAVVSEWRNTLQAAPAPDRRLLVQVAAPAEVVEPPAQAAPRAGGGPLDIAAAAGFREVPDPAAPPETGQAAKAPIEAAPVEAAPVERSPAEAAPVRVAEAPRLAAIAAPRAAPSQPPAPAPRIASGVRFAIGDRVELKVFETLASAREGVRSFVERGDLSGEMLIEAGGAGFAPFLGAVQVYGRSPEELTEEISRRISELLGFEPRVVVKLAARQPVFVSGVGGGARALDFQPGMLLLQALSHAGGSSDAKNPLWERIDLAREEERLRAVERTLARAQAKQAVIEAEIAGEAVDPAALAARLNEAARGELDAVVALRTFELAEKRQNKEALASELDLVVRQIADFHERVKESEDALADALLRANHSRRLSAAGTTNTQTLMLFEGHLREESRRNYELRSVLMRLDSRRLEVRNLLATQELEISAARRRALEEAKREIRESQSTIDAIGRWIDQAVQGRSAAPGGGAGSAAAPHYKICRSKPEGVSCSETSDLYVALEPGDIVEAVR